MSLAIKGVRVYWQILLRKMLSENVSVFEAESATTRIWSRFVYCLILRESNGAVVIDQTPASIKRENLCYIFEERSARHG